MSSALTEPSVIVKSDKIVLVTPTGRQYSAQKSHLNFEAILAAVKKRQWAGIEDLFDIRATVQKKSSGAIEIKGDTVFYRGAPMHNALTKRLVAMLQDGFDVDPLVAFTENLMENPSKTAVDELYLFLESNELPVTPDGHFLAYKNVTKDFKDHHTRSIDNSVGAKPFMLRNAVDDNRDVTCSHGLHFCSLAYLKNFHEGSSVTVIVKINPRDVVSIPSDYHNTKGRCCAYEVVGIHEKYSESNRVEAFSTPVVKEYSPKKPEPVVEAEPPKAKVDFESKAYDAGYSKGGEDAADNDAYDDSNSYRKEAYAAAYRQGYKDGYEATANPPKMKPASWSAPAKHARGNIFNADNGLGCCGPYGVAYLR